MEERKISVKNIESNYKIAGEGPAVLILHGWGGSSDSWIKVISNLSKEGFKVICPDLPGFGKSQFPGSPWSVSDYVDWVFDFVKILGIKNYSIIAHSFGGRIAAKFFQKEKENIRKLIFCGAAGIKSDPSNFSKILFLLARIRNALFSPKIFARFKDATSSLAYFFLKKRDYFKARGVMKETMQKVILENLLPYISEINAKTLLVWGEKDKMVPINFAKIFHDNIKGSKLEIMKNVGHSPNLEVPDEFSKIIVNFLKN